MNVAVILAGGTGSRVGADRPKQFIEVMGKPVLAYTLELFQNNDNIDAIEIVCHKGWKNETKEIIETYRIGKAKWMADGGETFQNSVINGLFHLKGRINQEDIVTISFGISPMTTDEIINDNIRVCRKYGNAIASDDLVLCTCVKDDEYSSTNGILRESLKAFNNPWSFRFGEICKAYETAMRQGILDQIEPHTTSLYFALGKRLYFSKSTSANIKITTRSDLDIFEGYLLLKQKRREEQCKGDGRNDYI